MFKTIAAIAALAFFAAAPAQASMTTEAGFNRLPTVVIAACRDEIAARHPAVAPATQRDIEKFQTRPEGPALVKEWGSEALIKFARLRGRLDRWLERMPVEAQDAALDWLEALSPTERRVLFDVATR